MSERDLNLVIGIYDDPEEQDQPLYTINLLESNLAIFGAAMSGKTTLLQTLLVRIHQQAVANNLHEVVYLLDFGYKLKGEKKEYAGMDYVYSKLKYVANYCPPDNEEDIRILFKKLENQLKDNAMKIADSGGNAKKDMAHITFIIDGLNKFYSESKYEAYHQTLLNLVNEGLSNYITVIFTANLPIMNLLPAFKSIIAFDLPPDKYGDLFTTKVNKPLVIAGRGIASNNGKPYEFQAFLPHNFIQKDKDDLFKELVEISKEDEKWFGEYRITPFPKELLSDDKFVTSNEVAPPGLLLGFDYYSHKPVIIDDLRKAKSIAIYGKKDSGQKELLERFIDAVNADDVNFVFWEDNRDTLKDIIVRLPKERCRVIRKVNEFKECLNKL